MNATLKLLHKNGWRRADVIRAGAAVLAAVVATYPAWEHMVRSAIRYEHARPAMLVPLVVAWLLWVRRSRLRMVVPGEVWPGWIMLTAGAQFYYFSHYYYGLYTAKCVGAILMVFGAFVVTTGKSVLTSFCPAWVILILLVPVPVTAMQLIAGPIQFAEAEAITSIYRVVGMEASVIRDPRHPMVMVGSTMLPLGSVCKGLATSLALLVICYGFVFGTPMRPLVRGGLLFFSPLIALLCSALSLLCTLWVYDSLALVTADTVRAVSEWVTLMLAFFLIMGLLRLLTWVSVPVYELHLASDY